MDAAGNPKTRSHEVEAGSSEDINLAKEAHEVKVEGIWGSKVKIYVCDETPSPTVCRRCNQKDCIFFKKS